MSSPSRSTPPPPDASEWSCGRCTLLNPSRYDSCKVCYAKRPTEVDADSPVVVVAAPASPRLRQCGRKRERAASPDVVDLCDSADRGGKGPASRKANLEIHLDKKTFKIMTYNVWFREDMEVSRRMDALGDLIKDHTPDFICFQEVTPYIYKLLQKSYWWKQYKCLLPHEMATQRPYYCMQGVVRGGSWAGSGGETVEQVGGGVETLRPKANRKRSLEQKGAHDIISGANHALSLAVLRGGVGTRHAQLDTMREEEGAGGMIIELTPVVTLDDLNGEAELSRHLGEEVGDRGERLRLGAQRKSPRILSKVPVKQSKCIPFDNSIMGRELCITSISSGEMPKLKLATTHLESPCPAPPKWDQMYSKERIAQAKRSLEILGCSRNAILCGDMNWDDKRDGPFPLQDGWTDAWVELKPGEDGWTYDTKANGMLSGNRKLQKRMDRFVCKLADFKIESIEMVGKEAIPGLSYVKEKKVRGEIQKIELPVFPSDHFGLVLTIAEQGDDSF
ncbi:hypothetical protein U9M48_009058 [Paspalum notatum var. saurae]|uniref:RanBP2-type domain-containing protein n=1 Tax=Paspalum notatum var. saurae TaxID=547442 RepID=A0AAQ3SQE8_PASNO